MLAALSVNRLFAGRFLDAIGPDVSGAGVVAVALTAAAGTRFLWHWRCPVFRPLGAAFAFLTAYQLDVLVSYEPPSRVWDLFGQALWPAIPLAYAAWGSAVLAISRRVGVEVSLTQDWNRYGLHARFFSRRWVPRPGHIALWLPAIAFSALSLVPGLVYSGMTVPGVTWHGQPSQLHLAYAVISTWGIVVLVGSALAAEHAWRKKRPELEAANTVLLRGAMVGSFVAVVCALIASLATATGFWPEPIVDLELAIFAIGYALFVTRGADAGGVSIEWRHSLGENAGVFLVSLVVAFSTTHSPGERGLDAAALTTGLTLLILSIRHALTSKPREPVAGFAAAAGLARLAAEERGAIGALLRETRVHTIRLYLTGLPTIGSRPVLHTGLRGDEPDRLDAFARGLVDVLGLNAPFRFLQLYYDGASALPDLPTARRPSDPSPPLIVRIKTSQRGPVEPDPERAERLRIDTKRLRLHGKSEPAKAPDGLPVLPFQGRIDRMSEHDLDEAWEKVKGRKDGRPKQAQGELLEDGIAMVRDALLDEIAHPRNSE